LPGGEYRRPYSHDWIEIFNRSRTPVNLGGWSIQYATATGSSWLKVDLTGTIQPGAYRLVGTRFRRNKWRSTARSRHHRRQQPGH
jgi:hypothetical protein